MSIKDKMSDMINKAKNLTDSVNKGTINDTIEKAKNVADSINKDSINDAMNKAKDMAGSINKENLNEAANKLRNFAQSAKNPQSLLTKRNIYIACAVCAVLFMGWFFFGEDGSISTVKKAAFHMDKRYSYGEILENYKYIDDPNWSIEKLKDGEKIVTFKAKYSNTAFAEVFYKDISKYFNDELMTNLGKQLDKNNFEIYLLAQFTIDKNDKINPVYIGYQYDGKVRNVSSPEMIDKYYKEIANNDLFKVYFLPTDLYPLLEYIFKAFLIEETKKYNVVSFCRGRLFSIEDIETDKKEMTINVKFKVQETKIITQGVDFNKLLTVKSMEKEGIKYETGNSSTITAINKTQTNQTAMSTTQYVGPIFIASDNKRISMLATDFSEKKEWVYFVDSINGFD